MSNKNDIISKIYFDKSGYGSMKTTLDDARKIDKSINISDVKQFFNNNVEKKTNLKGYNSFIAPHPYYEYQADLFFIPNACMTTIFIVCNTALVGNHDNKSKKINIQRSKINLISWNHW